MCGIVGFINRETTYKDKESILKWFNQALYCDALRGKHGTGVVAVNKSGSVITHKRALQASDFIELELSRKIMNNNDNIFMIGHNRYATKGAHTNDNTHPFSHGDIHMVHNGTIDNYYSLNKGTNTFTVDSDALAFYLSQHANVSKALEEVTGAYSLVWYDETLETLNFARNEERPMFFGHIKSSDSLLFASEKGMLEWIADRNGLVLNDIVSLKPGIHLSIPFDAKEDVTTSHFTPKKKTTYYTIPTTTHKTNNKKGNVITYPQSSTQTKGNNNKINTNLIGSLINFIPTKWSAYSGTSNLVKNNGCVKGIWGDYTVILPSILMDEAQELINKTIRAKIVNVTSLGVNSEKFIYTSSADFEVIDTSEPLPRLLDGPGVRLLSHKQFDELTKYGCSNCSCNLTKDMHKSITWDAQDNPLCPDCASDLKQLAIL